MAATSAKAVATGRRWIADSGTMLRVLQYAAMLDLVVCTHAEDAGLAGNAVATGLGAAAWLARPGLPAGRHSHRHCPRPSLLVEQRRR